MLVLNLPFKALMFLTLMRPSLVLFLVLWLKLVKDFVKVRCRLALLPFLISCLIWLGWVESVPVLQDGLIGMNLLMDVAGKCGADKGNASRAYLAAAFPALNAWGRAGADASSAGIVDAGFENQKELNKMQLDNQKEIAEMKNETQKEIAGIQSATSRQNTKDQVYAQNEMLAYQQKESTARVASIMENTNLSKQQQVSEIMRQMLTQAQTAGQYFTNDQIKEMTRKVSAEVDLVHQQTQNQRYGSSHIGATAKDISNVVTDAASGVVDI